MCGRYTIVSPPDALRAMFGYAEQPNFPARYNIAPTQPIPAVFANREARHFQLLRWGLLPAWVKDPRQFTLLIKARAETIMEKPAFKNAMKRRRCLIPSDGYYEWRNVGNIRQPYFVHRRDHQPFGFAGVMETWKGPNGEELDTAAIVTAAAGADLATLHPRVPVTIAPADFDRWLDCAEVDAGQAAALLTAPTTGEFAWHAISTRVNHVANDDAHLILPMSEQDVAAELAGLNPKPGRKASPRKASPATSDDPGQGSLF
jgi:putative SOS response-associated peptidase YedK